MRHAPEPAPGTNAPPTAVKRTAASTAAVVAGLAAWLSAAPAGAQEKPFTPTLTTTAAPLTEMKVIERVTKSTDRALAYLASKQNPDGSWHERNHAINAVTLLAFMGCGHTPGRGKYKDVLEKGKKFLLNPVRQDIPGYLSFDKMYEHGLATLALAEMYGMDPDPALEAKLRAAVDLIVKVQSQGGGWNYGPSPGEGDTSVTVMQIVALRAANNAEIPVPQQVIDKAVQYIRNKANHGNQGGYGYNGPGPGTAQTTAAGVLSLQLLGKYDDPNIKPSLDWMSKHVAITWGGGAANYFFYFHYYAIQAKYQAGGTDWDQWHPRVRDLLLERQSKDGSWDCPPGTAENDGTVGPNHIYTTAMGVLVLDIYMHYLPAYQR